MQTKTFSGKIKLEKRKCCVKYLAYYLADIFGHRINFVEMLTVSSPPAPVLKIMEHPSLSRALTTCLFKLRCPQPGSLSPLHLSALCSRVLFVLKSHFKSKLDKNEDMLLFLPLLKHVHVFVQQLNMAATKTEFFSPGSLSSGLSLARLRRKRNGLLSVWIWGEYKYTPAAGQAAPPSNLGGLAAPEGDRSEIISNFQENVQVETHFKDLHQLCAKS